MATHVEKLRTLKILLAMKTKFLFSVSFVNKKYSTGIGPMLNWFSSIMIFFLQIIDYIVHMLAIM